MKIFRRYRIKKIASVSLLVFVLCISVFPIDVLINQVNLALKDSDVVDSLFWASKDNSIIDSLLDHGLVKKTDAAAPPPNGFFMQTGKFVGNAAPKSITGLGFSPDLVIVKPDTTAGAGAVFKTKAMSILNASYFIATAQTSTGAINLESDGFTANTTTTNNTNVTTTWAAFGGSNCTSTGVFCVGSYVGNGTSPRAIDTGFQPDLVWVKRSTAVDGNWRSSSMSTNVGQYFSATAQETTGVLYTTLNSNGFTVGSTNNVSSGIYYYVAFKQVSGFMKVGSYTGNATDNTNITGVGFVPDFVFVKNSTAAVGGVFNAESSNGDSSNYFTDTANLVDGIQSLRTDGFQVGTNAVANSTGVTYFYAAFGGAAAPNSGSGTFMSATGSYTGTAVNEVIRGLDFSPDLVIIKGDTTQAGVFRTSIMSGDSTAYLDAATTNLAGAIISLNADGFTVGTSAVVNTNAVTYYWAAYGNAWKAEKNSGASDFYVGAYLGNGIDSRNIGWLPFQADLISIKANAATAGTFRTSAHSGDQSGFYAATAEAANNVQSLNSDGFQVGTAANVNTAATVYWYFGFKNGTNFKVGTYSGTGSSQTISAVGFQPDYIWIKATAATRGVQRNSSGAANSSIPFINVANVTNAITAIVSNGFTVGTAAETNSSGTNNYRYVAWKNNYTPLSSPSYTMKTGYFVGNGAYKAISGLGFMPELIILKSDSSTTGTLFKSKYMPSNVVSYFIATADSTAGIIALGSDGFTVSSSANTNNVRYTWIAFTGSDCSATGVFCTRQYVGDGLTNKTISAVGFQPDLVISKRSTAVDGAWRSSSMGTNVAQFFSATVQETGGLNFTTLNATGFTVGTTLNASGGVYYYIAFKSTAGSIFVGTYTGNATDNRNITGVGFIPDFVFVKKSDTAAAAGVMNVEESHGDNTSYFTATANLVNSIQALQSDGFQIGTDTTVNTNSSVYFYVAFGGGTANSSGSGTFTMATGSYVGNGNYKLFTGLNFSPDLIIIKGNTTQAGVFRSKSMGGDSTAYLDSATANLAGAIVSINSDGFTIANSATVNSNGITYYWTAYGNAWKSETNSGAADFYIGAYYGNGIDSRNINRLPYQADMVAVKRSGATAGVFRTSAQAGDLSSSYLGVAETTNLVQSLNSDGFQIGTAAGVNSAGNVMWFFGFKTGTNFAVGTYSGTGSSQTITGIGFKPDHVWVKHTGTTRGVLRTKEGSTDSALPFLNVGAITGAITALASNGITVGTAAETNTSGSNNYRYVAWRTPTVTFSSSGTKSSSLNIPSTNNYVGAAFTAVSSVNSIDVTRITLTETGTVNATSDLANVKLYYETAGTCVYDGTESQFGSTQSFGIFEYASFSGTMSVGTSQVCIYPVVDVGSGASGGQTLQFEISLKSAIDISAGVVEGSFPLALAGTTTLSSGNTAPNNPATLVQAKTDDTVISAGGWINQTSVKFSATVSDTDNPDTLSLCVEVVAITSSFTGTETACGSGVSYSGTPLSATVTISSLTENYYKWQARVKDTAGAYSSWVVYYSAPSGLIGYWQMNETSWTTDCSTLSVIDSSSNTFNGTSCPASTGPTTTASGQFNRGGQFDGSDDRVQVAHNAAMNLGNNMTLEAWVKPTSVAIDWQPVINKGSTADASSRSYSLNINYANVTMRYINGNGAQSFSTTTSPITAGVWTHIAYTRNGTTEKIYVNGVEVASQTFSQNILNDSLPITIGGVAYGGSGVEKFGGTIDEVKIYNVARDLNGVRLDMNGFLDFGTDTSNPSGGTVYDGTTTGVDINFNNGSLSTLSANWSGVNPAISGLSSYDYSIGTSAGGTDVVNWTTNSTSTSVTVNSLTLQSSNMYYFNVRTNDYAGNSAVISSNGQVIAPSLTFSISSNTLNFSNLNPGNSYSDTKTTTLTTSTNAYNGYIIRLFKTGVLTSVTNPSTISDFAGGTYAAPANWGSNNGFGYTSNDTTIQGVNKFNPVTCAGGGSAPCYAPISSTAPGDIVADHTTNVTGSPITNEQFQITYKVQTPALQPAGTYSTSLVYTIIPQY